MAPITEWFWKTKHLSCTTTAPTHSANPLWNFSDLHIVAMQNKKPIKSAYHHNLKSWDNDSKKPPPWKADSIAIQEWNHEQSIGETGNNV